MPPFLKKEVNTMYEKMKQKTINKINEHRIFNNLLLLLENMFEYENIETVETFNINDFNRFLLCYGKCGVIKEKDNWYVTTLSYQGNKQKDGLYKTGIFVSENSEINITHEFDDAHLYCRNNNLSLGEMNLIKYAELFNENDKSLKAQIINTRLAKIMKAVNDKQKAQIDDIKNKIIDGELTVITSDIVDNLLSDNTDIQLLDFTDNTKIDKLQYIQTNYENLLKRFLNFYGIPLASSNKLSQVNEIEVKSPVYYSNIYKTELLRERENFFKKFNSVANTNIKVKFSDAWTIANNDFKENNEHERGLDNAT